jgi:hypothetical protein
LVRVCAVICVEFEHRDGFKEQNAAQNPLVTFTSVVQAAIPNGQLVAEGRGMHRSIKGAVEAISRSATLDVRASSKKGHGPQEYTTLSNDSFLKTTNCVELHTISEFEEAMLTLCCSDMTELPMAKKSGEFEASCDMLEFDADIAGPGCTHGTELNPVASSTQPTFTDALPEERREQPSIASWVGAALDDSTSRPADVPLESVPSNEQPVKEAAGTSTTLKPAPPDTTEMLDAPATLQAPKLVFTTLIAAARNTAAPPPRTAVKGEYCPAPLAEQFQKVLDDNTTEALLLLGMSTDTPPPLLFEGDPTAPIATVTEQLLNDDDCRLTSANATLLAYTAPPPPLAFPGRTDLEFVTAEQAEKLEIRMENVRLDPASFSAWGGWSQVASNSDT